jgi:hypothetical protein
MASVHLGRLWGKQLHNAKNKLKPNQLPLSTLQPRLSVRKHVYVKRIGPEDMWQCQMPGCRDKGPLKELLTRECTHPTTQDKRDRILLDVVNNIDKETTHEETS